MQLQIASRLITVGARWRWVAIGAAVLFKGSLEDTSELRRVEERCDWKGEGNRGDVN